MSKMLDKLRNDVVELIDAYNVLIVKKGDFASMNRLESEIREAESTYAERKLREVISECEMAPEPILAAVERYEYHILSHRINRTNGVVTNMELVEDRTKRIDLVKLCKVIGIPHLWEYKVEEFGNMLCMRSAKDLGWSDEEIEKISCLYYRNALCQKQEVGAIPTSNTQIIKMLQSIIDLILPVDHETGKSKYRCNSHDVAYLSKVYTRRSNKKKCTVTVAKNSYVHQLIMDVMHRIVKGIRWGLEYQMLKEEPASVAKAAKVSDSDTVLIPRPVAEKAEGEIDDELPSMEELCNLDAEIA